MPSFVASTFTAAVACVPCVRVRMVGFTPFARVPFATRTACSRHFFLPNAVAFICRLFCGHLSVYLP